MVISYVTIGGKKDVTRDSLMVVQLAQILESLKRCDTSGAKMPYWCFVLTTPGR